MSAPLANSLAATKPANPRKSIGDVDGRIHVDPCRRNATMTPERSHEWIQLAASRSIDARSAAGDGPPWLRTVGVMETAEGPTLVGAGARDPTIAQKALAESFGPRSHKHAQHEIRSRPPPPILGTRAVCIVGNHL